MVLINNYLHCKTKFHRPLGVFFGQKYVLFLKSID